MKLHIPRQERLLSAQEYLREMKDSPPDEYAFNKTVVPLRMASFGESSLISRSQAKRVVRNLEKFHTILLDFTGIETVGQGFADEIFRVYQNENPDMEILPTNANEDIQRMIKRAIETARQDIP